LQLQRHGLGVGRLLKVSLGFLMQFFLHLAQPLRHVLLFLHQRLVSVVNILESILQAMKLGLQRFVMLAGAHELAGRTAGRNDALPG
jgi:hypothetical protein